MSTNFTQGEPPFDPQEVEIPPVSFKESGKDIAKGMTDAGWWDKLGDMIQERILEVASMLLAWILTRLANIVGYLAKLWLETRERMLTPVSELASLAVSDLFGTEVNAAAFEKLGPRPGRKELGHALGQQILHTLVGTFETSGPAGVQPSDEPAAQYLAAMADLAVEGWFEKAAGGFISSHPFENIGELKESVAEVFGFGRLTRRVLGPYVKALIEDPTTWKLNKTFRPNLLSVAEVATQYHRGKMTAEQATEELARQGWSDQRIEALLNANSKMLGVSDLAWLVRYGTWSRDQAIAHLRDQGWDEDLALAQLEIERLKRLDVLQNQFVAVAVDAYVRRDIDNITFQDLLAHSQLEPEIQEQTRKVAALKRELSIKDFSESNAEQAIKRGIWTFGQYRALLDKLGYSPDDIISKELMLRDEINDSAAADRARKELETQRAAEKQAKLDAARARQAKLEFEQTHQEISLADAKRGYVTGILTRDQYQSYLERNHIIADDQTVLLELADQDHDDYLAQQDKRRQAEAKLAKQNVSLSQLERAVKQNLVALGTYREELITRGFSQDDADLLVSLLQSDIDAAAAAEAARAEAKAKLENVGVNLGQEEQAVLAGVDTIGDYRAFLIFHKFTPEAVETLVALMRSKLDDRAAALQKRAEAEAKLAQKKINLADLDRAVRLGFRTMGEYRQRLQAEGFSVDDVATLVALLQQTIDDDRAKAARKAEIEAKLAERHINLADVERAVKLGLRGIDTYKAALVEAGIAPADQQLLVDLLVEDMRLAAAARAKREQIDQELSKKKISLSQFEQLVKQGIRTIDDYVAFLLNAGYSSDDAELLAELLALQVEELDAARARKKVLDQMTEFREVSRQDLEKGVRAGLVQVPTYRQWLRDQGYSERDVELLEDLILLDLAPAVNG